MSGAYGNTFNNSSECFIYRGFSFHFLDLEVEEMFLVALEKIVVAELGVSAALEPVDAWHP